MNDENSGRLPAGWVWATIGEVTNDGIDQQAPTGDGDFVYVDISSVDNKAKRIIEPRVLAVTDAPSRARQRLSPDDIVVSMTRPNLNAVAMVPESLEHAIGSTGFHVLRSDCVSPKWLYFLVQSSAFVEAMTQIVQGVVYPAVRPKDIRSFQLALPPRPEQDRIVAVIEAQFTRLDAAIAGLKRTQANLKRYRASVLAAACSGQLVPTEAELAQREGRDYESAGKLLQRILIERREHWNRSQARGTYKPPRPMEISDLPELPAGWTWASLDQLLGYLRNGLSTKPDAESGVPILRISAVRPLSVNVEDVRFLRGTIEQYSDYQLNVDDLLFTRYNGNPELVGVCGVVRRLPRTTVHPDKLIRGVVASSACLPRYLEIVLNVGSSRHFLASRVRTTAGQSGVSGSDLKQVPVPLAPLCEQHRIVAEVDQRLSVLEELQRATDHALTRAERLRQSILRRAFEGTLVPQDPTDEPADVLLERIRAERAANTLNGRQRKTRARKSTQQPLFDLQEVGETE